MSKLIEGRISDMIYSPSGKHISLFFFNMVFEKISHKFVEEFQVVYKKISDEIIIKIVPGNLYDENIEKTILVKTKQNYNSIPVCIKIVEKRSKIIF